MWGGKGKMAAMMDGGGYGGYGMMDGMGCKGMMNPMMMGMKGMDGGWGKACGSMKGMDGGWGKACGKGGGKPAECKWCTLGECWTHGGGKAGGGKAAGGKVFRSAPYTEMHTGAVDSLEPATPDEVEVFISTWGLDDKARYRLEALNPKFQTVVISQTLEDARDKIAVVITRINNLEKMKQGDWICPACMDIQFGKNSKCRKCGAPNTTGQGAAAICEHLAPASQADVDAFIETNGLEESGQKKLNELDPKLQTLVMSQSLENARDKTAVMVTRIVQACKMKPGDWICPDCMDIQFSKNSQCRKCGAQKPDGLLQA